MATPPNFTSDLPHTDHADHAESDVMDTTQAGFEPRTIDPMEIDGSSELSSAGTSIALNYSFMSLWINTSISLSYRYTVTVSKP